MNIKERIERLGVYFNSMNVAAENNIIYVRVQFPKGWGCSELTEHNFNVTAVTDEIPGYFYFFADMEVGFDKIFDAIDYNIQFNEEAQAKVTLLREKIEELKNIFENEDISVLKTLEFKYKKKRAKTTLVKKKKLLETSKAYDTMVDNQNENVKEDEESVNNDEIIIVK